MKKSRYSEYKIIQIVPAPADICAHVASDEDTEISSQSIVLYALIEYGDGQTDILSIAQFNDGIAAIETDERLLGVSQLSAHSAPQWVKDKFSEKRRERIASEKRAEAYREKLKARREAKKALKQAQEKSDGQEVTSEA